jgi:hypothetical protein
MTEPDIPTQIRIQANPDYWYTVEDVYLDVGCDGLTISSYWETKDGKRRDYVCIEKDSALAIADAIYKLFKKEQS